MVRIEPVTKEKAPVLSNLLQKYLYEMTRYYDDELKEDGNFEYRYLPLYFEEADRRAYFIYQDAVRVGFALVNTHSFTGEPVDNCLAEFTIFPAFRKKGLGAAAVAELMRRRTGIWQLKYSTVNAPGAAFWTKIKERFHGTEQKLDGTEIALTLPAAGAEKGAGR